MAAILKREKWGELIPEDTLTLKRAEKIAVLKKQEALRELYKEAAACAEEKRKPSRENYGPNVVLSARMETKRSLRKGRTNAVRMWKQTCEEKRQAELRMKTFTLGVASFKKALTESKVHAVSVMRELPAMFAKSTGGHVKTICVETSDGERDCRVAFLSDMAKLIGYQVSVYAGVERVVVTLIKPVVQLTPYEREAVHYEAHIYKFSA